MTKTKQDKIPCDCPKGGLYENENGSTNICKKCDGSEWVVKDTKQDTIEEILKEFDKQYTEKNNPSVIRVESYISQWKTEMVINPNMIKSFIKQSLSKAIKEREIEIVKIIEKEITKICKTCEEEKRSQLVFCTKNHDIMEEFYKRRILEDVLKAIQ